MGEFKEINLQTFIKSVQSGVYGIKSDEIAKSKELASIFGEAAKADFDNNNSILSTDEQGYKKLVQEGVDFAKQFFDIQDTDLKQKEQELIADIETIIPEYIEAYVQVLKTDFNKKALYNSKILLRKMDNMMYCLKDNTLREKYNAKIDAEIAKAKEQFDNEKAGIKKETPAPAKEEPAKAEEKTSHTIHVFSQHDPDNVKEGDFAVRGESTYRFTDGRWIKLKQNSNTYY